ncbi:MAG: MCP four helix bundle domain-containing protein [Nitrospira sp.]|uniref:4HB_MCP_1 domain-containing protein n=1 Tax=Nitrospira defluvii TaxID=330214 RepID=A0ABM8RNT3_9BACT|nr:MCP four helix bundle domain-containing protein [Nitrospira defluvii]MCS6326577.1 MCP four helix bundle domain-containing protein [Nitrospira sp.]CAE6762841.1 4HB_MCP_1 domain-containing protein [Nitrospira defluvii]
MSLASRFKVTVPGTNQLIISLLIAGLGWVSGQALSRIDQDLRIMYTEYTLGAADLAHISADVIRYRNTIIRSLEAENQTVFERITESLPAQRAKIQHAVDRYAAAGLRVSRSGRSEEKDIQAVRESLDQYFHVASKTIDLLSQEWRAGSAAEATELRRKAEIHAADNGGPKVMQVSLALDRLLETVAEVAKDMREAGTKTILTTSYWIVGGSFFIALLNLFIGRSQAAPPLPSSRPDETTPTGAPLRLSGEGSKPALHTD